MRVRVVTLLVVSLCLAILGWTVTGFAAASGDPGAPSDSHPNATIVDLYPNPNTTWDKDEFVTVRLPANSTLADFELADKYGTVALQATNATKLPTAVEGATITFSMWPERTDSLTDRNVGRMGDAIQLADHGDTVQLRHNGEVIDEVQYGYAREGEIYDVTTDDWQPLGATDKQVTIADGGTVEAFVLPDEPDRARELLASADERIQLAGYTISAPSVVDELETAIDRGVEVEILADGSPVGGMLTHEAAALDELHRAGATVRVIDGELARYRFHHAKYAIVDERALVTTENWNQAGLEGKSSRGWAVITDQQAVLEKLERIFTADSTWVDAIPWSDHDPTIVDGDRSTGTHPQHFEAETLRVDRTEVLVAPDNAADRLLEVIDGADESIDVKQVRIGDENFRLLQAVLDAADRGVDVRILLSGEWYAADENRDLKHWLEEQAEAEDWPLEVRLADPDDEFEKIHAKGLIVDDEIAYVGSTNWNNNSVDHNREVGLLLWGSEVGEYFGAVFAADWQGESAKSDDSDWLVPVGLAVAVALVALLAVIVARQLEFEPECADEQRLRY